MASKRKLPPSQEQQEKSLLSGVSMSDFRSAAIKMRSEALAKARREYREKMEAQASSSTSPDEPEEVNELEDGRYRLAKFKHQNAQLASGRSPARRQDDKSASPPAQTPGSSPSQKGTPAASGSTSKGKPSS